MPGPSPTGRRVIFLVMLFLATLLPNAAWAANHFIVAGGTGTKSGMDWNNAYADLPSGLIRGDAYFIAGSATSYGIHTFNDADSGTSVITIYKAVDCSVVPTAPYCGTLNPASVAGWQASYGTTAALWQDSAQTDPQTQTASLWQYCSDYYVIDGITGITDPIAGPSGQGFVLKTQNRKDGGIVAIGNAGCGSSPSGLTNLSFSHLDVGGTGPMPYFPAAVTACSYSGGSATITSSSSVHGIIGDPIAGWTSAGSILFLATNNTSISSTQVVVPLGSSPCSTLAYVALDLFPPIGFFLHNSSSSSETFTNVTVQNSYIHDISQAVVAFNEYSTNILNNYLARNRSTPTQHSSMIELDESANATIDGPVSIAYNFILNASGTGTVEHLGQATGCSTNCGTINGLAVYGNVITCDAGASAYTSPECGVGHATVGDNAGQNNVVGLVFYNNTMSVISPAGPYLLSPGSTGAIAYNNLFYNIPGSNGVRFEGAGSDAGIVHDYNTVLNSTLLWINTCEPHDYCTTSGSPDPFVADASHNFNLTFDMSAASDSRTAQAQGLLLPSPYNLDFAGIIRGADATWERGAYEFEGANSTKPNPPTNLQVSVQ